MKLCYVLFLIGVVLSSCFSSKAFQEETKATNIVWNSDNSLLAVGYKDGRVRIIDVSTGEIIKEYPLHNERITHLAWSQDSTKLLTGGWDNAVKLVNILTDEIIFEYPQAGIDVVYVAWSPDETQFMSVAAEPISSDVSTFQIWDAKTGENLNTQVHLGVVSDMEWNDDYSMVAAGTAGGAVGIYEADTWKPIKVLSGQPENAGGTQLGDIEWDTANNLITGTTLGGKIIVWDVNTSKIVLEIVASTSNSPSDPANNIFDIYLAGNFIHAIDFRGYYQNWSLEDGHLVKRLFLGNSIQTATFSNDKSQLAYASIDGEIHIVNVLDVIPIVP
jgi:WD40 repeat protein